MDMDILASLIPLAQRGAMDEDVYLTSNDLAKELHTSQQTANRRLQLLEAEGYITRGGSSRRQLIRITPLGTSALKELFHSLYVLFSQEQNEATLRGKLISGMGEGKYYISHAGYRNQFINKMGFSPYPGTLNIKLDEENLARFQSALQKLMFIKIERFTSEHRSYGAVKAYKATIGNKIEGAVIIPYRTHHQSNIIEIIAPVFLRKELQIQEGGIVDVTLYG